MQRYIIFFCITVVFTVLFGMPSTLAAWLYEVANFKTGTKRMPNLGKDILCMLLSPI